MRKMTSRALLGVAAVALAVSFGCTTEPMKSVSDARFVGSETCGTCHQEQYKTWKDSYHAKMVRPKDVAILKDSVAEWGKGCHDASYTVEKYMPGTGQTAAGLFIRTHTFNKGQARAPALTASGNPVYQNPATK